MSGSTDSKPSASAEHARFESAAIYLALGPSASSKQSLQIERSTSETTSVPPLAVTSSTSFKRAHSPEHAKAIEDDPPPAIRPTKRSRTDSNMSTNVGNQNKMFPSCALTQATLSSSRPLFMQAI